MEKTYNLFKKYLPPIITLTVIGMLFGILTFINYYNHATMTLDFLQVIPVFTVIFIVIALAISCVFTSKVENLHLSRLKKNSGFSKFSALLAAILASALFFYNFFKFVQQPGATSALMIMRLMVFIPFIAYLIITILPKKFRKKTIVLPTWVKPTTSVCTLIWCLLSLLAIYFHSGASVTNMFKLIYIFYYIFVSLFFLFEVKFDMLTSRGHRGYILFALVLFVYTCVIGGSITVSMFLGQLRITVISDFEIFLSFAMGLYAISKVIAMQTTLKFVMKKRSSGEGHRHHHHHHRSHSSKNTEQVNEATE